MIAPVMAVPLKNRTHDPLFEAAARREHRFWCWRHGDFTKVTTRPCPARSSCPQCDIALEAYTAANVDGRLGPSGYPVAIFCHCRRLPEVLA